MFKKPSDISSEVNCHLISTVNTSNDSLTTSSFQFEYPSWLSGNPDRSKDLDVANEPMVDEDGDLVVNRRQGVVEGRIILEHAIQTSLEGVGSQLWRGALYLADFLLTQEQILKRTERRKVLEVGAGTGFLGVVAACHPSVERVVMTDLPHIIPLINKNVTRNLKRQNHVATDVLVLGDGASVHQALQTHDFDLVLSADIIYDDKLSEGIVQFISAIAETVTHSVDFLLSFEKRFNFTLEDLDVTAPAYDFFMNEMRKLKNLHENVITLELIEDDFPQCFCYERTTDLFLMNVCISPSKRS